MSLFAKMFGGKNKESITPQQAIQNLSEVQEMLMKKSAFLEKKIEGELATAKKNGTKNKRVALQALKRKKRFEKQLANIDGTLSTIEFQREALENASTNTEVLRVMGFAAKAMKSAHKDMDVDKVHDVMDEIAEQQDVANEISEAISNPVGFGEDVDEDDLLAELEDLEQEQLDEQLLDVGPISEGLEDLPSVPTAEPKAPIALQALKRKKRYEKQLTVIDGTLSTIEFQREALENANTNTEVLKVMQGAAKAMKGAHKNLDVDQVHNMMDEVADQQEVANEITEAISNPVGFGEDVDEDELLSELEELEQAELDEKLLDVGPMMDDLPSVPTQEPKHKKKTTVPEDEDDMRELAAWAS